MLALVAAALVHVPTYGSCVENCCTPPHHHDVSQVIYLRGPGGLELHLSDLPADAVLDFDVIFRDAVDQDTYSLYVGCGGCVASQDALEPDALLLPMGYQPAEVEPFTQTRYRSAIRKEARTMNVSELSTCTQDHFTIRLVDHLGANRTVPIVWGAVVGLQESFTPLELLLFPIYVLRNHGDAWNELPYTFWLWLFLGAPLYVGLGKSLYKHCCGCYMPRLRSESSAREWLYQIAIVGFTAAALEQLTHLVYAQAGAPIGYALAVGFVVILAPNALGMTIAYFSWRGLVRGGCLAHRLWAPLELLSAVSLLFLFGAGFYVGPAALGLAALLRCVPPPRKELPPPPVRRDARAPPRVRGRVVVQAHMAANSRGYAREFV